jgi:hypothetical protein
MIHEPNTAQIVDSIRDELRVKVTPQLTDPATVVAMQMIDELLANVATRAAHEIGWMREEIDAIDALAADYLTSSDNGDLTVVAQARAALHAQRADTSHLEAMSIEYRAASDLLSSGLEASIASGDPVWRERWRRALSDRLGHELSVMGNWGFVGRG